MNNPATLLLLLLLPGVTPVFGGQSIIRTPSSNGAAIQDPMLPHGQSWRVELHIHDWVLPEAPHYNGVVAKLRGTGWASIIQPHWKSGDGRFAR